MNKSYVQYGMDSEGVQFVEYQQAGCEQKREWFTDKKSRDAFALQISMWLHCKPVNLNEAPKEQTYAERDAEIVRKMKYGATFLDIKLEYDLSVSSIRRILRKAK